MPATTSRIRKTRRIVRRRKKSSTSLISAFVYSIAAIICIALGGIFYVGYQKTLREQEQQRRQVEKLLPPGRVVKKIRPREVEKPAKKAPSRPRSLPKAGTSRPPATITSPATSTSLPETTLPTNLAPSGLLEPHVAATTRHRFEAPSLEISHTVTLPARQQRELWLGPPVQDTNKPPHSVTLHKDRSFWLIVFDTSRAAGWDIQQAVFAARLLSGDPRELAVVPVTRELTLVLLEEHLPAYRVKEAYLRIRNNPWITVSSGVPAPLETDETNLWLGLTLQAETIQDLIAGGYAAVAVFDEGGDLATNALVLAGADSGDPPVMKVLGHADDIIPPGSVSDLTVRQDRRLARRQNVGVILTWIAPGDDAQEGQAYRYEVRYGPVPASFAEAKPLPADVIPWSRPAGSADGMVLTGLEPETAYNFYVRAVDEAGVPGPIASVQFVTPPLLKFKKPPPPRTYSGGWIQPPGLSAAITVSPAGQGLDPTILPPVLRSGPAEEPSEKSLIWERDGRTIHLEAVRGQTLRFNIVVAGDLKNLPARIFPASLVGADSRIPAENIKLYRILSPRAGRKQDRIPDPLLPLPAGTLLGGKQGRLFFAGQNQQAVLCEIRVPDQQPPGIYRSTWKVSLADKDISLLVFLRVVRESLEKASARFVAELCSRTDLLELYRGKVLPVEIISAYCRAASEHGCVFSPIPYQRDGSCPAWATPGLQGEGAATHVADWTEWDQNYAWLTQGEYQGNRPALLPLWEQWPIRLDTVFVCPEKLKRHPRTGVPLYAGASAQVASCISNLYWAAWRGVAREFVRHLDEAGVNDCHVWLLNDPVPGYQGLLPWRLGHPSSRADYTALENYGSALHAGAAVKFRVNVMQAAHLTDCGREVFDIYCVADSQAGAWETVRNRAILYGGEVWRLLPELPLTPFPHSARALVVQTFLRGGDGLTILETAGSSADWTSAAGRSLLYCGQPLHRNEPLPSWRLKMLHEGLQDVLLLTLLQQQQGWTRNQVADFASQWINLDLDPEEWDPDSLDRLRAAIIYELSRQ